jgi:hypothetical protein
MEPITARALCLFVVVGSYVFSIVCRACGGKRVPAMPITGTVIGKPRNRDRSSPEYTLRRLNSGL